VDFTYHLGSGKPVVQLTPEADYPVFAQVLSWEQDGLQNYTGFTIKTFGLDGNPASAVVHYQVVAKPDGYDTLGQAIYVPPAPSAPSGGSTPPSDPPPAGDSGSGVVDSGSTALTEEPASGDTSGTVAGDTTTTPDTATTDAGTPPPDTTATDATTPADSTGTTDTSGTTDASGTTDTSIPPAETTQTEPPPADSGTVTESVPPPADEGAGGV